MEARVSQAFSEDQGAVGVEHTGNVLWWFGLRFWSDIAKIKTTTLQLRAVQLWESYLISLCLIFLI